MTGPLKRLGAIVPRVIRKFLKRIDPQRVLVGLTPASHSFYHTSVNKADLSLTRTAFFRFVFFFFSWPWTFSGQGSSPCHRSDKTESLIARPPGNSTSRTASISFFFLFLSFHLFAFYGGT